MLIHPQVYRSSAVHRSVIYLCSFLPHSSALTTAGFCLSKLKSAPAENLIKDKYPSWTKDDKFDHELFFTTYVDALCNWRRGDDVLEMIQNWLNKDLKIRQKSGEIKKRKGVRFDESSEKPRPGFGLVLLRYVLSHSLNKSIVLKKNLKQLEDIKYTLEVSRVFIFFIFFARYL